MNPETREYIKNWLIKAEHDILNAETVIQYQPIILDTASFHCQQAVENGLKAYLVYKGCGTEKTHNLFYLLEKCIVYDTDFSSLKLKNLNDFSIDIRYPDDFFMPEINETKEYLALAQLTMAMVKNKIRF